MARYIDADKLCENLKTMAKYQEPYKQSTILSVVSTIENTPTADVVEVVRCKECNFYIKSKQFGKDWCNKHAMNVKPTDFCSCGAKMDGGIICKT